MRSSLLLAAALLLVLTACGDESAGSGPHAATPNAAEEPAPSKPASEEPSVRLHARDASSGASLDAVFLLRDENRADLGKSTTGEFSASAIAGARWVVVLARGYDVLETVNDGEDATYGLARATRSATLYSTAEVRVPLIVQWVVPRVGRVGIYSAAVSQRIALNEGEVQVPVVHGAELQALVDIGRPASDRRVMWPAFVACEADGRYEFRADLPRTVRVRNLPGSTVRIVVLPASWRSGVVNPHRVDGLLDRNSFDPWDVTVSGPTCEFSAPHLPLHLFVEAADGWEYLSVGPEEATVEFKARTAPGDRQLSVAAELVRGAGTLTILPGHLGLHEATLLRHHLRFDKSRPWVEALSASTPPSRLPVHSQYTILSDAHGVAHVTVSSSHALVGRFHTGAIRLVAPGGAHFRGSVVIHDQPKGTGAVRSGYLGAPDFARTIPDTAAHVLAGLPPGYYRIDGQLELVAGEHSKSIRLRRGVAIQADTREIVITAKQ